MTALSQVFDVPEAIGLIPQGVYTATLNSLVEEQGSADGREYYRLAAEWHLPDGQFLKQLFNVAHPNVEAARIAREDLQKMAHAMGVRGALSDTDQVVGKQCSITVVVNGKYNNVRAFEPLTVQEQPTAISPSPEIGAATQNPFG